MISQEALDKFKEIWRKEVGEEISDVQATKSAIKLLTLFDAIYRPLKKEWLEEFFQIDHVDKVFPKGHHEHDS